MTKSSHSSYKIRVCEYLNVHLFILPEVIIDGKSAAFHLKDSIHISLTTSQLKEGDVKGRKRQRVVSQQD